jgi:NADH-quinone oxidoreductase subunit I
MLCATACPAHCIDIVGATAPPSWPDREKYPESFVIDELRCIYCGMCEEACPVEAIELKLLSVFDVTRDAEPMKFTTPPPSGTGPTQALESPVS